LALKWRDLDRAKRTFGMVLLMYMGLNLYLSLVMVPISIGTVALPFGRTDSSVIMWSHALSFVGVAYLLSLTHPRKEVFKAELSLDADA